MARNIDAEIRATLAWARARGYERPPGDIRQWWQMVRAAYLAEREQAA